MSSAELVLPMTVVAPSIASGLDNVLAVTQRRAAMRQRELVFPHARAICERLLDRLGEQPLHPDGRPIVYHAIETALEWAVAHQRRTEPKINRAGHIAFVAGLLHPLPLLAQMRFVANQRQFWDVTSVLSLPAFMARVGAAEVEVVHQCDPLREVDAHTIKTVTASRILTASDLAALGGSIHDVVSWRPAHGAQE
jgi:hypothetical protein